VSLYFAYVPGNWENVKQRFKKIESYHIEVPREQKYIHPKVEDHGTVGPLHLSYADPWEKGLTDVFQAAEELGLGVNPDVNSGNPIGSKRPFLTGLTSCSHSRHVLRAIDSWDIVSTPSCIT